MVKLFERRAPSPERKQWCRPCASDSRTGPSTRLVSAGRAKKTKKKAAATGKPPAVDELLNGPGPLEDPIGNLVHLRRMVAKLELQVEAAESWRERASRAEAALDEVRAAAREADARCVALAGDLARREEQAGALARALEASERQCEEAVVAARALRDGGEAREARVGAAERERSGLEERLANSEALNREMARERVVQARALEELRGRQIDSDRYRATLRRLKHDNARLCRILANAAARGAEGVASAVGDALRDEGGATHISEAEAPEVWLPRVPGRRRRGGTGAVEEAGGEDAGAVIAEITRRYGDVVVVDSGSVGSGGADRWVPVMSLVVMDELRVSLGLTEDQFSRPCAEALLRLNALWRARGHKVLSAVMGRYNKRINALSRDLRAALQDEVRAVSATKAADFHNLTRTELEGLVSSSADMVDRLGRRVEFLEGEHGNLNVKLQRAAKMLLARKPEADAVVAISDRASASFAALVDQVKDLSNKWQEETCAMIEDASRNEENHVVGSGGMMFGGASASGRLPEGGLALSRKLVGLQNEFLDKVEFSLMRWRDGMEEIRKEASVMSDNLALAGGGRALPVGDDVDPTLSEVSDLSEADSDYDEFAVRRGPPGGQGPSMAGSAVHADPAGAGREFGAGDPQLPTIPYTSMARKQRMDSMFSRSAVAPVAPSMGASITLADAGTGTAIRPRKLDMDGGVTSVAERRRLAQLTGLKAGTEALKAWSGDGPSHSSVVRAPATPPLDDSAPGLDAREGENAREKVGARGVPREAHASDGAEAVSRATKEPVDWEIAEEIEEIEEHVADGSDDDDGESPYASAPVRAVGESFDSYRKRLNEFRAGQPSR